MLKTFKKLQKNKRIFQTIIFIVIIVIFLFNNTNQLYADETQGALSKGANFGLTGVGWAVATVVGFIAMIITSAIGLIITVIVQILINVVQFNNIINVPTVIQGWVVIRDLCNMFFILILLIIAFATILRVESYNYKKILPKLLIMAVLINFSRTIFGLIIDAGQVVMLTFVNAFSQGGGWFIDAFQVNKWYTITSNDITKNSGAANAANQWSIVLSMVMGIIASIITLIVMAVLLAVFVMRVVMLWIYTIFSPLIFLGFAVPAIQKYTGKIWEDFTKQVIVGPVLAFFIWLALVTAQDSTTALYGQVAGNLGSQGQNLCGGLTAFFCDVNLSKFIITIGLLMGGLMMAQQMGGVAASIAGKGLAWAKQAPLLMGKTGLKLGSWGARKLAVHTGLDLRPAKIIGGFRQALKDKAEREDKMAKSKAGSKLTEGKLWGGLGASQDFAEAATRGFMWHRGWAGKKSVIGQTRERGKISKGIKDLEGQLKVGDLAPAKRKDINEKIASQRKELEKYKPIETFYANEARNTMARDKIKFFYDSDNADQLHSTMMNAMDSGQSDVALAAYIQLTKAYHDNEALNKTKATADYYDENGVRQIKEGEFLPVNQDGQRAFAEQYLMGKLHLSAQEAWGMVSQSCTISKANNHYNLAEGVTVVGGMLVPRSKTEQEKVAAMEFRKGDPEQQLRKANRHGHMEEHQAYDPDDPETDLSKKRIIRYNVTNGLTERNFGNILEIWEKEINTQKRFNPNAADNLFGNWRDLEIDKKRDPDKRLFKEGQRDSLVDIGKRIKEKIKDSKDQREITAEQIAWQTLNKGASEYYTNKRMEITESNLSEDDKKEKMAVLDKEAVDMIAEIKSNIDRLEALRPPKPDKTSGGAAKEPAPEPDEEAAARLLNEGSSD